MGSAAWREKVPRVATQIFVFEPFSRLLPTFSSLPLSCFFVCIHFVLILVQASFLVHTPRPLVTTPLSSRTAPPLIANPLPRLKSETGGGSLLVTHPLPRLKCETGGFPSHRPPPPLPQERDKGFPLVATPPPLPQERGGGLFVTPAPLPRPKSEVGGSSLPPPPLPRPKSEVGGLFVTPAPPPSPQE